jgi:hypothetical protein
MNLIASFLLMFLMPTQDVPQAGLWVHSHDTLVITNTHNYYTNAPDIYYMCSNTGKFNNAYLVGTCVSGGAFTKLQSDTLFVLTTNSCAAYLRLK